MEPLGGVTQILAIGAGGVFMMLGARFAYEMACRMPLVVSIHEEALSLRFLVGDERFEWSEIAEANTRVIDDDGHRAVVLQMRDGRRRILVSKVFVRGREVFPGQLEPALEAHVRLRPYGVPASSD